jgi:hypothetical protein
MSKTTPKVHSTHTVYTAADFTTDEINRRNVLAVAVIDGGHLICKQCGCSDRVLAWMCFRSAEYNHLDIGQRNFEIRERNAARVQQSASATPKLGDVE